MNSWRRAPSVRSAMLVAEGDTILVEANDAVAGDRDTEDVTGQVAQHGLIAFPPGSAVDNPTLRPCRLGQGQIGAALGQRRFELAAHELGQGHERNQEAVARRMPIPARRCGRDAQP